MVCVGSLRSFIVRTGNLKRQSSSGRKGQIGCFGDLDAKLLVSFPQKNYLGFRAIVTLMAESGTTTEAGAVTYTFPEKDFDEEREGGYASGGWKRYLLFLEDFMFCPGSKIWYCWT